MTTKQNRFLPALMFALAFGILSLGAVIGSPDTAHAGRIECNVTSDFTQCVSRSTDRAFDIFDEATGKNVVPVFLDPIGVCIDPQDLGADAEDVCPGPNWGIRIRPHCSYCVLPTIRKGCWDHKAGKIALYCGRGGSSPTSEKRLPFLN